MIFSQEFIEDLADQNGFQRDIVEKQLYLLHMLREVRGHPFLRDKFALKGGAAINLFLYDLPRLSVDIDLNYIGAADRETMMSERPQIESALRRILESIDIAVEHVSDEHAGGKWRLNTRSVYGTTFTLEFDINYLFRVPLGTVQPLEPYSFDADYKFHFPVVSTAELYGGKFVALLVRGRARDLYDTYKFLREKPAVEEDLLRRIVLLFGVSGREDWRLKDPGIISQIDEAAVQTELLPMLSRGESFNIVQVMSEVRPYLEDLLDFTHDEQEFVDTFLDHGTLRPEFLSDDPDEIEKIHQHPAIQWKLQNVQEYLRK